MFSKDNPRPDPQLLPMWEAPPKRIFTAVSRIIPQSSSVTQVFKILLKKKIKCAGNLHFHNLIYLILMNQKSHLIALFGPHG